MTISTEVRKAGPFIGNDSASVFPFAFKVFKAADLIVVRRQDNIGAETTLVLDSDYHVTLNSNQDTTPGGVVTLVAGALASGFTLVVSSELPYLQPTDLTNQGGFYPKVITNALDRLTIFCQQLAEITGRTLKLPITAPTDISAEIPLPNPSELIAWDETGTRLTTISPQSLVTSIAYGSATADLFAGDGVTTTFPLSTNPASVNNLDVSVGGFSQRPVQGGVGDYSWNGGASITFVVPPPAPAVPGDKNVLVRYMQAVPVSDSEALHAQTREALRRGYAEAGYNLVDGSFETGGTLTSITDVMLLESAGTAYAWTGVYPGGGYDVAPGIDPTVVAGYVSRADVVLRGELAGDSGAELLHYKTPMSVGVNRALADKLYEIVTVTDFPGVVGDGVTDCADGLDLVMEYVGMLSSMSMFQRKTKIRFPSGHYKTSRPFILWDGASMSGDSQSSTLLEMTSSTATTGITGTTPVRNLPRDVNCCVAVFSSVAGYPYRTSISDIQIFGVSGAVTSTTGKVESAIYAPEAAFLTVDRVRAWYTNYGILSYNLWMCSFRDLDLREHGKIAFALLDDGTGRGGSTSCGFARVYAHTCSGGFWLYGLNYSTMNSCGADSIGQGLATNRSESPYVFYGCQGLVCNGIGAEAVYTRRVVFIIDGHVTLNEPDFYGMMQNVSGEQIYLINVTTNGNLVINGGKIHGVNFDKTLASECYAVVQTNGTAGSVTAVNSQITETTVDVNGAAIGNVMYGTRIWRGKITNVDGNIQSVQSSTKTVITTGTTDSLIASGLDSAKYVVTDAVVQLNKSGPTPAEAAYKIQVTSVALASARIYISNHDGAAYFGTLPIRVTFTYQPL